jgi:hypothetical protein
MNGFPGSEKRIYAAKLFKQVDEYPTVEAFLKKKGEDEEDLKMFGRIIDTDSILEKYQGKD